jgi:hypothetical protein
MYFICCSFRFISQSEQPARSRHPREKNFMRGEKKAEHIARSAS